MAKQRKKKICIYMYIFEKGAEGGDITMFLLSIICTTIETAAAEA